MVWELKLRRAGGSIGVTLPKDLADRFHLEVGDAILAMQTDQGIVLTPYDPRVEKALRFAARGLKRFRHTFRALAR